MSNQKNKLRRGTNYKLWLYIGIIFFLILLGFGLYLAYMMIDYEAVYSTPVSFNVQVLMDFFNYLSAPQLKAGFGISVILECFKMQAIFLLL